MVRRRLNKKVAFIGSAFFVILILVCIIVLLQLKRSPVEFIKDAETALQTARQSTDQKTKDQYYEIATKKYSNAYARVQTNEEKKEILFDMVDLFIETQNWPYVLDCWEKILLIEPDNVNAQYGRLRYFEAIGDSGIPNVWKQVYEYASKFLKIAQENDLMSQDMSKLKIPELEQGNNGTLKLGAYLYLVRGKGAFEQANMGSVTNTEEILESSIADFEKAKELEPNNIDVYLNLAKSFLAKGELAAAKGSADKREKAEKEALTILEQAVDYASDKVNANINLINFKVVLARDNEPEQVKEIFKELESEYLSLADEYSTNPYVYEALSQFYSIFSQYTKHEESKQKLDKSIEAILKAMELDEHNVVYAIQITDIYYRRYSIYKNKPDLDKAIEIAKNALSWPGTQSTNGPGNNIRIRNKYLLNTFLANSYIEQILDSQTTIDDSDKKTLLSDAQEAVNEIEMIIRTDEDPTIIKWKGMLELAGGNKQEAIIKLNKAYEQFKAVKPAQQPWPLDIEFAKLSYTLAKLFMDTEELGKAYEYLLSAHYSGITEIKPEARLDYVEVILKFNRFTDALDNIEAFEEDYGQDKRSQILRVKTYIYSNKYEEAQKELDKMPSSDAEAVQLRLVLAESKIRQVHMSLTQSEAQVNQQGNEKPEISDKEAKDKIKEYVQAATGYVEKLLEMKPELVTQSSVINICGSCITINEIQQAKQLVDKYLSKFPDNIGINIYKQILSEPEPGNITQQRYIEIEEKTISSISDPIKRAVNTGILYTRKNDLSLAIEQFNIALEAAKSIGVTQDNTEMENIKLAANNLFEISLSIEKYDIAESVIKIAQEKNLDDFHGLFYEARLKAAKKDFANALKKVDECLKERPISSQAYLLRSNINAALGNEYAYIEDVSEAANLNPLDSTIARKYAIALYNISQNSGSEVSTSQHNATRDAMEKAISLNQGDLELLGLYTELISASEPKKAIAIRQDILSAVPNLDNAVMLGTLAMNVANNTSNPDDKEAFLDIAGSAFEQARMMDPNDRDVLIYYTKYLRARGRDEEAKKILQESKDSILLANDLFLEGDFENARKVLENLYRNDSNNIDILRGLVLITQNTNDKEAVKKYSNKLISVDNNLTHLILQIRAFVTVGLFNEAEYKLQSLKEKYPDNDNVYMLQAWLAFKQGNAKKALDIINTYIQGNKNNPGAWQLRSEINVALNEYQRAISDLKTCKSLTNDPSIGVSLAKVYIQTSNYEEAEKELKEIVSKENSPMEANVLLENIYFKLNRKTALENLYDKVIEKYPDDIQWLSKAAEYALQTKEFDRAQKFYKKSCDVILQSYTGDKQGKEIDDDLYVASFDSYLKALLRGTGDVDMAGSHPEKSELVLKEAAKYIDSSYAPLAYLRMTLANLLLRKEDEAEKYARLAMEKAVTNEKYALKTIEEMYPVLLFDEMSKYCSQMLEKNPDSLTANYAMYFILRADHKYAESVDYINKCIELTEKNSPIRLDYIMQKDETLLYTYANTSDNQYINIAINDYQSLLSEMPNNIQVLNNLAYMLAESGQKLSDALEYSERVQKIKPNDPGFLDTYAFVLLKNKQYIDAEKTIEKALTQYNEQGQMIIPAEVYEHKGMIKEELEKNEEALAAYKRAMDLGSSYFSQKTKDRIFQAIIRVSP
ncbi:MAG: hypothetical protein JXA96_04220 [Sedimentisphaerales bacterium]|nr:hypothetical protein [Sedimentisphaerales bacterium]